MNNRREPTVAEYAEDVVKKARLVDKAMEFWRRWKHNTPSFDPEKRRFIKSGGALAGTLVLEAVGAGTLEFLLGGCAGPEATKTGEGIFPSRDWRDVLMEEDPIRGPGLTWALSRPRDFQAHQHDPMPWYGVDYDVPIGTPIVPGSSGPIGAAKFDMHGGNTLGISSRAYKEAYWIQYKHLSSFVAYKLDKNNPRYKYVELNDVVAFSGDTGRSMARGEPVTPHLHFQITEADPVSWKHYGVLDPFTFGIDGGRPVYWDTKTNFFRPDPVKRKQELNQFIENLPKFLQRMRGQIDNETKRGLLDLRADPVALKKYLAMRVLTKKPDMSGRMNYEFLPGSDMYHLMIQMHSLLRDKEFIISLPFIYPPLIGFYKSDERNKDLRT